MLFLITVFEVLLPNAVPIVPGGAWTLQRPQSSGDLFAQEAEIPASMSAGGRVTSCEVTKERLRGAESFGNKKMG